MGKNFSKLHEDVCFDKAGGKVIWQPRIQCWIDDKIFADGIPAIYFDELYPVETLVECVQKILDLFAPHLILGISDEISSTGDIERIRLVGRMVDEYNEKIEKAACAQA